MNSCSSIWKSVMSGLDGKKYKCTKKRKRRGGGGGGGRWEVTSESESGGVYNQKIGKPKKKSWIDTPHSTQSGFFFFSSYFSFEQDV